MSEAVEAAYRRIRHAIMTGQLPSGERLREAQLGQLCNVSRTPIREALRRLERDGVVSITPNSGAIVSAWVESELADLFLLRASVEGLAAALAAERRSTADLKKLEQHATQIEQLIAQGGETGTRPDLVAIADANQAFHRAVIDAARSRALDESASRLLDAASMLRAFSDYDRTNLERSSAQHLELCEAIRDRDADWARSVMSAHILAARREMKTNPREIKN
jgi:DNA-binding GntR family transcriptional regulator